ncbi:rubredoxin [Catalinimonas alkaloidigena]|nr:rubredoxin [Catalinimonas alkaloidigena]
MTTSEQLVRVFVKGGILSPGDFRKILEVAQHLGFDYFHLGSRQDILFPVPDPEAEGVIDALRDLPLEYELNQKVNQNIVSSYVSLDVMPSTKWLASHIYHYVLDTFDYQPQEKINLVDPMQSMVPLFTGNINFIASQFDNYWYLYIRYSELDPLPWCAPDLIYGFDLAKVARAIEQLNPRSRTLTAPEIYRRVQEQVTFNTREIQAPLTFPEPTFPYYEGMNRTQEGKYWLGLYWRNNCFYVDFMRALCDLCLETNVGKLSLTPWKSFIVKGIAEKDRVIWEKLLGKNGINVRHSSLELNWHLPVLNQEALELKKYFVRMLDQQDISTYGLTFTVKTQAHKILFTSVVIEKNPKATPDDPDAFNVLYARDFNPNTFEYFTYARRVSKEIVPSLLIELSKQYYDQLDAHKKGAEKAPTAQKSLNKRFRCRHCLNIYDEAYGDALNHIAPETPFADVPDTYQCPVCGSPKADYEEVPVSQASPAKE